MGDERTSVFLSEKLFPTICLLLAGDGLYQKARGRCIESNTSFGMPTLYFTPDKTTCIPTKVDKQERFR